MCHLPEASLGCGGYNAPASTLSPTHLLREASRTHMAPQQPVKRCQHSFPAPNLIERLPVNPEAQLCLQGQSTLREAAWLKHTGEAVMAKVWCWLAVQSPEKAHAFHLLCVMHHRAANPS